MTRLVQRCAAAFAFLALVVAARADITVEQPSEIVGFSRVTVAAKHAELGNDFDRLFAFVRDLRHDVYRGVLRGGRGTLLSEAGNALDKSILLQELLTLAGHQTRFAHGTLEIAKAEMLLKATIIKPRSARSPIASDAVKLFLQGVRSDTQDHYRTVKSAIEGAGISFPNGVGPTAQELIGELRDHYWLQVKKGDAWIDLDPSFPEAQPGQTFTAAAETLPSVPDRLFHRVSIQVVLEELKDQQLKSKPLLAYEGTAASLSARPLLLAHQLASWKEPVAESGLGAALEGALGGITDIFGRLTPEHRAKPLLIVGDQYFAGEAFDLTHRNSEGSGRVVSDVATGEWIAIELRAPDGTTVKTERWIFDRIGFAARSAGRRDIGPAPLGAAHPLAAMICIAVSTGPLTSDRLIPETADDAPPTTLPSSKTLGAEQLGDLLAGLVQVVALVSDRMTSPAVVGDQKLSYVHASPRVIISAFGSTAARARLSLDLRHAASSPLPYSDALADKNFHLNVLKGVLDGVLETEVMNLLLAGPDMKVVAAGSYSTSQVFKAAAATGIKPVMFNDPAGPLPSAYPPDAAARMLADLRSGHFVIAPERSVDLNGTQRMAWWRVDRATGRTTAVTEDGLHQAGTEYVIVKRPNGEVYAVRIVGEQSKFLNNSGAMKTFMRQMAGNSEDAPWGYIANTLN
jgi:hypothetical protein